MNGPLEYKPVERFVVAEQEFALPRKVGASFYATDRFMATFRDLIEEAVPAMTIRQYKLMEFSADTRVISLLGGIKHAKVALAHAYSYMQKITDTSESLMFFVADKRGRVWNVDVEYDFVRPAWILDAPNLADTTQVIDLHRLVLPEIK